MTLFVCAAMVLAFAALITRPFIVAPGLRQEASAGPNSGIGRELWAREKAVAMIAMKEAEFDRATGKLTDADYSVLRGDYEERALRAMKELDVAPAGASKALKTPENTAVQQEEGARFCTACGNALASGHRFCGACGAPRT